LPTILEMPGTLATRAAAPEGALRPAAIDTAETLRIALVQMAVADRDPNLNVERAASLVLGAPGAQLYLLPELWTTGYAHDLWEWAADSHTPGALATLHGLAEQTGAYIAGSMISRTAQGELANRLWMVGPGWGAPVAYDKCHLFGPMGEPERLAAGESRVTTSLHGWRVSLSICFDLRFPEGYRQEAVDGARLFLVSSAWPAARGELLRLFARARAAENQCWLALGNRAGEGADGTRFAGGSALFAPDGTVVAEAGEGDGVVLATADRASQDALRASLPVLACRRLGVDFV
jgi:predicted amidohydrolase